MTALLDNDDILIVPGYRGSDSNHWQSWLEARLPRARRVRRIDWQRPVISEWAGEVRREIQTARRPLWVVAHSFGCLASVIAINDRPEKVLGAILVAPADPRRFHLLGHTGDHPVVSITRQSLVTVDQVLPTGPLSVPGLLVSSDNDPWLHADQAVQLAASWGLPQVSAGAVGHINSESGFGPWPWLIEQLSQLAEVHQQRRDELIMDARLPRGRGSAMAHIRQLTRQQMERHIF